MRHHAIVVTGYGEERRLTRLDDVDISCDVEDGQPTDAFLHVTEVSHEAMNEYRSFLVCPDGSKEGWTQSTLGDEWRRRFIDWIRTNHVDVSWIEVQFGDDDGDNRALQTS